MLSSPPAGPVDAQMLEEHGISTRAPIPQVFNGAVVHDLSVPSSVIAGREIRVTGLVTLDCPLCSTDREVRVVGTIGETVRTDNVGALSGNDIFGNSTAPWELSFPTPAETGQTLQLRIRGERKPPLGGWETDSVEGPFDINVVTEGEKTRETALSFAPWGVGGGAVGVGAAQFTGRSLVGGGVLGVGAGVATKIAMDQLGPGGLPDFPTFPVLATAGLLGAGALFLTTSGIGNLTRGASSSITS